MAITPFKTWISGEVLTASDLNSSFSHITSNATSLISPLTAALDLNGLELILDNDGDTSITADTDDRIDFKLQGSDLFVLDGTTATAVNGLTATFSAAGNRPNLAAHGTDTNIGLGLRPKGTGAGASVVIEDGNGNEVLIAGIATASAVNEITATNAATGNAPSLAATGGDTDIGLTLRAKGAGVLTLADGNGNEVIKTGAAVASAVNELTATNAATGNPPVLAATGGDTNIGLRLTPKGTGRLQITDGTDPTKVVAVNASGLTTATTRTITIPDRDVTLNKAPTFTSYTSGSGTYNTPAGCQLLRVRIVGGGGGGGGASASSATNGGAGGTTTFGSTTAVGGSGGTAGNSSTAVTGGLGGTGGSTATGTEIVRISGSRGGGSASGFGGDGGNSAFFAGGAGTVSSTTTGQAGATNSGGGGGGAAAGTVPAFASAGGGGESVEFYVSSPASSYSYAVGAGGTAGTGGTANGGAGGTGVILIEEIY